MEDRHFGKPALDAPGRIPNIATRATWIIAAARWKIILPASNPAGIRKRLPLTQRADLRFNFCTYPTTAMALLEDYQSELRRFITGQHLYAGIRVTACVIIPALILHHYGLLTSMVSIPLGALFVGLTDNPGPIHHRRNGMLVSIAVNFLVVLIAGLSRPSPVLIGIEIAIFGFAFSIISVFGTRAGSIGLTGLIIFILSMNTALQTGHSLQTALLYLAGGILYLAVSLSLTTLRPYRPVQQLLGECLMKTSSYLSTKALFYKREADHQQLLGTLIEQQVEIHQVQEQLWSMLFTTRRFMSESTHKGRILTVMFRDSVDLFERAVATNHDYAMLRQEFSNSDILEVFQKSIHILSVQLYNTGLAVQEGSAYQDDAALQSAVEQSSAAFERLRRERMNASNLEAIIRLRHILHNLQNLSERIRKIMLYTTFEKSLSGDFKSDVDFSKFPTKQRVNINLLLSNLSLRSSAFRHALRLTIALLLGYAVALFFAVGHGYWILLTIATIIKPAYSLSKNRNIQRLLGTFAGVVVGFVILFFTSNNTVILVFMIAMMITAYSLLKVNYAVSIFGITVYLMLSFHFLNPLPLTTLLTDRIIDTLAGCMIAYIVSYFVLPLWEYLQIEKLMHASIDANRRYFENVAEEFTETPPSVTSYKVARKEAFVSLANLSDAFQRMLSDPKSHQPDLPLYHQFVSADHLLTSHIASLSDYPLRYGSVYKSADFQPLINLIRNSFSENNSDAGKPGEDLQMTPIYKRVKRLLEQRKSDIEKAGIEGTPEASRKMLSELVRITDQFRLVDSAARETLKIAGEIREKRD